MKTKIAIIEDDALLASSIVHHLKKSGYEPLWIYDLNDPLDALQAEDPQLLLLDINLPVHDGFYWCEQIRTRSHMPIVFISSRNEANDTIEALRFGGDDYVTKPFRLDLLQAKIEALLRRNGTYQETKQIVLDTDLVYHLDLQCLYYRGKEVALTPMEKMILHELAKKKGRLVSRTELMMALWETDLFIGEGTLTTLISRLRQAIREQTQKNPIKTAKGKGYYIE